MPYITPEEREPYLRYLEEIVAQLPVEEEILAGHLNFCISYMMNRLLEERCRYVRINTLMGAIEGAKQEFYRVHVIPYEEKKRKENGDV